MGNAWETLLSIYVYPRAAESFSVALVFICLMGLWISVNSMGVHPHIELSAEVSCYI